MAAPARHPRFIIIMSVCLSFIFLKKVYVTNIFLSVPTITTPHCSAWVPPERSREAFQLWSGIPIPSPPEAIAGVYLKSREVVLRRVALRAAGTDWYFDV